jgi:hypothetical protein
MSKDENVYKIYLIFEVSIVVHAYNGATQEAEAEKL